MEKGNRKLGSIIVIIAVLLIAIIAMALPKFRTVEYENTSNIDNYPQGAIVKSGSAKGYKSDICVDVIIKGDEILDIVVTKHGDTNSYFNKSSKLIDNIVETQSIKVDTISGATKSSEGILKAVENALAQ